MEELHEHRGDMRRMRKEPMDPKQAMRILIKAVQPRLRELNVDANMHDLLTSTADYAIKASGERIDIQEAILVMRQFVGDL
jgi:hypothetical protein